MAILYRNLETCPRCGAQSYGRCMVGVNGLMFVCKGCGFHDTKELPPIKKKIVYLDQFALSKIIKNTDEPFWGDLYQRLLRLTANEVITCPFSPIHAEESKFNTKLRAALKGLYRTLGGDDELRDPEEVEERQLARSLRAYIGCTRSKATDRHVLDAFEKSPHRWSDVFHVYADMPPNDFIVEGLLQAKNSFHAVMQAAADHWRANPVTFDEQIENEVAGFKQSLQEYRRQTGGNPERYCRFTNPVELDVVDGLVRTVQDIDPDEQDPLSILEAFAGSQQLRETPCIYLKSRIWAKIAELVCNPSGSRKPRSGDRYDAKVLTSYAPYCDAMFLDGGFREIAIDSRIACEERFAVRIFSEQVRDEFIAYLEEVEQTTPAEHWKALCFVHGIEPLANQPTSGEAS